MKTRAVIAGFVLAALLSPSANAQVLGPVPVEDLGAWARMGQQIQQFTQMIQNQMTSLANEAANLAKLPNLNFGNVGSEVSSVSAQAANIPAQIRGIVASNQVLANAPTDAARTTQINAAANGAQGIVGQQQATNAHLSNLENIGLQGNAAAADRDQAAFANTATAANDLGSIEGVPVIADP